MCLLELPLIGARYNKLDARIMFPVEGEIIYVIVPLFSFFLSLFEFQTMLNSVFDLPVAANKEQRTPTSTSQYFLINMQLGAPLNRANIT